MSSLRSVLVTGASSGLGFHLSRTLAAHGWRVFAGLRRGTDFARLQDPALPHLQPVLLDVTDAASISAACNFIAGATGATGLHGLVNNAGLAVAGPVEGVPPEDWRRQFEVNVTGVVAVTQAMLPALRRAAGRIVMMSSVSGLISYPLLGPYAASKHALEAISDALRLELASEGLAVTLIEPGEVRTPIWEKSKAEFSRRRASWPSDLRDRYARWTAVLEREAERAAAHAPDASAVVRAVHRALTVPRPPARIRIGAGAHLGWLIARLPTRWRDGLVRRLLDRGA